MAEYIERSKEFMQGAIDCCNPSVLTAAKIKLYLEQQPAADVVEVVRCKDCKYWCISQNWSLFGDRPFGECLRHDCTYWYRDEFCNCGVREEKNNEFDSDDRQRISESG